MTGTPDLAATVSALCTAEISHLVHAYGTENGPGAGWLPFHNATHTQDVMAAVERIGVELAQSGRLSFREVLVLRVAAAFHDHEQDLGPGTNEQASADAAAEAMGRHPDVFSADDIAGVRRAIMATRVEHREGRIVQLLDTTDIWSCVLADADLAHLGGEQAIRRSLQLDRELQLRGGVWSPSGGADPDRPTTISLLGASVDLLGYHRYHLPESRRLFEARQQDNRRRLHSALQEYTRGTRNYAQLAELGRDGTDGGLRS